jgi:CBASS immunity sensor of nucleotide second messenger signals
MGTVHLFMAVPAGLAMLTGQLLNTFGSVQTYEHVTVDGSGRYKAAALLRPNT